MVDWTAVAALATVLLGVATLSLAWQSRQQVQAAKTADTARQREVSILAVRPLLIQEPDIGTDAGLPIAVVHLRNASDVPILNPSVTIRGIRRDGNDSVSADIESLAPGGVGGTKGKLEGFTDLQTSLTLGPGLEVVVTYHGILDQWVVEHYEWLLNARRADHGAIAWRLYRLEIEPRGVPGAASIDHRFGAPPAYR